MASTSQNTNTSIASEISQSKSRRSRKRERHTARKRLSANASPSTSGPSTPRTNNGEPQETTKANGSMSTNNTPTNATSTFAEGDDFIPFTFSDPSDNEAGPSTSKHDTKGKGKGKEVNVPADDADVNDLESEDVGKGEARHSNKSARAQEKSKMREPPTGPSKSDKERDRKRGYDDEVRHDDRSNKNGKRRYDEYDDGYANKKQRTDAASRKCPWVAGLELERCSNVAEMLHREVDAFVKWISPSPVEDEIRSLIVTQISNVIKTVFADATIYPFGSYATKLYLPLGDIDLVVFSDTMAYSNKAPVLYHLANTLKHYGVTSHVTIIAKAKVPIIKFITTHGRFKVDISLNQSNGLVSGNIILGFLKDLIPRSDGRESQALRSLVMITKAFLSQRSMNEVYTGGLGSYSIVCLAVSFLQMHPKIRRGEIDPEQNLGVLVMEFFELYGLRFNYEEVGISLRDGGTYFNKHQRGWQSQYKRNMICIEDPADTSNDISAGSYNFHKVRTAFAGCHAILTSTAYLRAGILGSRRDGKSVNLRGNYQPEDLSILSTVMGITQETINHRRLVQELYDQRVLHNILGIPPLPILVHDTGDRDRKRDGHKEAESSKSKASRAVQELWEDADRSQDHDDFDEYYLRRQVDDDNGRYDIGRQPPKKRQRTGADRDKHTVYVIDDEEEDMSISLSDGGIVEIERPDGFPERPRANDAKRDNRRAYWLSKGAGFEGVVPDGSA